MAEILLNLHLDKETIAASLIYSCVNYAELCLETVYEHLGPNVAKIIEGIKQMNTPFVLPVPPLIYIKLN